MNFRYIWTLGFGGVLTLGASAPTIAAGSADRLGPPAEELLEQPIDRSTHPEADRVILYRGTAIRLDPDGTIVRRVRQVQRLLTDRAVERFGDERIACDTTRQVLTIHTCRTFMADRTEVPIRPEALNWVTADRVAACPDRATLFERVITHLGVERGCLIELEYTLADRGPWRPWLEGREELSAEAPMLRAEVRIETPGPLLYEEIGSIPGLERDFGEQRIWRCGPVPAVREEPGTRPDDGPAILYSTCPQWRRVAGGLAARIAAAAEGDGEIEEWAAGTMAGGRPPLGDRDRLESIGWLIGERIHRADSRPLAFWVPPRPAGRTFAVSCGDLLDAAALSLAALRACGIPADLVLLPGPQRLVRAVPCLVPIEDLAWETPSGVLRVSDGAVLPRLGPEVAEQVVVFEEGDGVLRDLGAPNGTSRLSVRIREEEDGSVRGEAELRMGGVACAGFRSGALEKWLGSWTAEASPGGTLAGFEARFLSADSVAVLFSWTGAALGQEAGDGAVRVGLPAPPGSPGAILGEAAVWAPPVRTTPLLLPAAGDTRLRLRIEPAEGTRLVIAPRRAEIEAPAARFRLDVGEEEGAVVVERDWEVADRRVGPAEYPAVREVALRRFEETGNQILFRR